MAESPDKLIDDMSKMITDQQEQPVAEQPVVANPPTEERTKTETIVTPWEVQGDEEAGVDYDKLIKQFGCTRINQELIDRFERVTGKKCHHFIRRGIIYSHREIGEVFWVYFGQKSHF